MAAADLPNLDRLSLDGFLGVKINSTTFGGGGGGGGGRDALWSGANKNRDVSTGPLACPFARSLAHFAHSLARGTVNDWMAIYSFFSL